jgi:hypothetical protein
VERRYIPFEVGREEIYPNDDRGEEIYPTENSGEEIYPL